METSHAHGGSFKARFAPGALCAAGAVAIRRVLGDNVCTLDFCPRCDAKNAPGNSFCRHCGASMSPATIVVGTGGGRRPEVYFRVVRADGGPEAGAAMEDEELLCGRTVGHALPDDPFVADPQVRFFFSGDRLAVEDVGGGNGVFLRIHGERELPVGSELRLGRQRLLVESIPPASPAANGALMWGTPDGGARLRVLQLLEGGLRGNAFPLREGENLLGRELGELCFPQDGFVSGRHALLTARGDRLTVRDLGSSNGTFVRLPAPSRLDHGDQILVGRHLVRVEITSAQPQP